MRRVHPKPLCIGFDSWKGMQWVSRIATLCLESLLKEAINSFLCLLNTELLKLMVATVDSLTMVANLKHNFARLVANLFIVFHDYQLISD